MMNMSFKKQITNKQITKIRVNKTDILIKKDCVNNEF